jgi:hypothetical protein
MQARRHDAQGGRGPGLCLRDPEVQGHLGPGIGKSVAAGLTSLLFLFVWSFALAPNGLIRCEPLVTNGYRTHDETRQPARRRLQYL